MIVSVLIHFESENGVFLSNDLIKYQIVIKDSTDQIGRKRKQSIITMLKSM